MVEGPHTVAAIILETVVGTNGILVPPDGYLAGVRELCDRHGIVMISDEVMAGFGRCGEWFAVDHWGVAPDLICFAKGVNSGYVPLGGVVISRRIADTFRDRPVPRRPHLLRPPARLCRRRRLHPDLQGGGHHRARPHARQGGARPRAGGDGRPPPLGRRRARPRLFWALELVRDRATREPLVPFNAAGEANQPMAEVAAACKAKGLWPFTHFNRVHVAPPLTISADELRHGLAILDEALAVADRYACG